MYSNIRVVGPLKELPKLAAIACECIEYGEVVYSFSKATTRVITLLNPGVVFIVGCLPMRLIPHDKNGFTDYHSAEFYSK